MLLRVLTMGALVLGTSQAIAQEYTDVLQIDQLVAKGRMSEQSAVQQVLARNEVQAGATARYVAGQSVTLQPGFTAQAGAVFEAAVRPVANGERLQANVFPNPFSGEASVEYKLPQPSRVQLILTDAEGRAVQNTNATDVRPAGQHVTPLNGATLPTGVYLLQVKTERSTQVIRVVKQ